MLPSFIHYLSITALLVMLVTLSGCVPFETNTIYPELIYISDVDDAYRSMTAARDLTIDSAGHVYVFDYHDNRIHKIDPEGRLVTIFGGQGEGQGQFTHLMAIRAHDDRLLALDEGNLSVFNLSGEFQERRPFSEAVLFDHPRLHPDGRFVGERIIEETAEQVLSYRANDGQDLARLAGHDLRELFPGIVPGQLFFINPTQARAYLYDFLSDGRVVWTVSDEVRLKVYGDDGEVLRFAAQLSPLPYAEEEITAMRERQASLSSPLFMNLPEHYQLVQHLFVDGADNVWLYLTSRERTGFLRVSPGGKETGFFTVEADFDPLAARVCVAHGRLYFLVPGRKSAAVYRAPLP